MLPKPPIFRAAHLAVWQSTRAKAISQCQLKAYIRKVDCQGLMAIWQLAVDMRAKGLLQPAFLRVINELSYYAIRGYGRRVTLPTWQCTWQCGKMTFVIWSKAREARAIWG